MKKKMGMKMNGVCFQKTMKIKIVFCLGLFYNEFGSIGGIYV